MMTALIKFGDLTFTLYRVISQEMYACESSGFVGRKLTNKVESAMYGKLKEFTAPMVNR